MAQWNKTTQDFLNQERSLFEVYNIADHWGNQTDWRPQFIIQYLRVIQQDYTLMEHQHNQMLQIIYCN